jgi:hypothetical protein
VTTFAVDRKGRWNTTPRWRRGLFPNLTHSDLQIAGLVEFNGLKTRVGTPSVMPSTKYSSVPCPGLAVNGRTAKLSTEE